MIIPHVHHKTKLLNLAFGVVASLLASFSAQGQTPQERHTRIRSAMDSGDVSIALAELNSLRVSMSFTVNHFANFVVKFSSLVFGLAPESASC